MIEIYNISLLNSNYCLKIGLVIMGNKIWMHLRWRQFSEYQNFFLDNKLTLLIKLCYEKTFVFSSFSLTLSISLLPAYRPFFATPWQLHFSPIYYYLYSISFSIPTLSFRGWCSFKNWWNCLKVKGHWNIALFFVHFHLTYKITYKYNPKHMNALTHTNTPSSVIIWLFFL